MQPALGSYATIVMQVAYDRITIVSTHRMQAVFMYAGTFCCY